MPRKRNREQEKEYRNRPEVKERIRENGRKRYQKNKDASRARVNKWKRDKRKSDPEFSKKETVRVKKWRHKNRDAINAKRREARSLKNPSPTYLKERAGQNKRYELKKVERERLLSLMTPKQRIKFIANERRIIAERLRTRAVNAALKKQSDRIEEIRDIQESRRTQKRQLEIEAMQLQIEGLQKERRLLNQQRIDLVVARMEILRKSRIKRYNIINLAPRDRYLWAIDYYYQMIEDDNAEKQSKQYLKGTPTMKVLKVA